MSNLHSLLFSKHILAVKVVGSERKKKEKYGEKNNGDNKVEDELN